MMKFSRIFLNRLQNEPSRFDAVVVIDVLRSFTTAAVALARGVPAIYPVEAVSAAFNLANRIERACLVGAVAGGNSIDGFEFGNSPAALLAADLGQRPVVMSTAAGVRGLQRFHGASHLFAASLVCGKATAAAIRQCCPSSVCFVITGDWVDRDGDEDVACADYIEALLSGQQPDPAEYAARVRHSDFGERFRSGRYAHLPLADLDLAAEVDRFDFAMPVSREDERLVIRPQIIRSQLKA